MKVNSRYYLLSSLSRFSYSKVTAYLMLLFTAILFGLAAVILPVQFIIAFLMIPFFLWLTLKFSEYAVFVLILVLLGGIPNAYLPQINLAAGRILAEDVGLIVLFLMLLVKRSISVQKNKISVLLFLKPYLFPLGGMLLIAIISAVIAVLYQTAIIKYIFVEARIYFTWLLLPILFMSIDSKKKFNVFTKMVLVLVVLLSLIVVFESFTGIPFSDKGQDLRELWTSGQGFFQSVNRSTTPGIFLISAVFIYFVSVYVFVEKPVKNIILLLLLNVIFVLAILVGFGRGVWLSVLLMIVLLGFLQPNKRYVRLVFWMASGFFVFAFILFLVKPAYVGAIADRFLSVSNEVKQGASLDRRFVENSYAIERIIENPILGVGLGGNYKPPGRESNVWPGEVRYIHSTYVNIATKTGVFGLFFSLIFVIVLFQRLYRVYKKVDKTERATDLPVLFAVFSVFLSTLVVTSFTQPNLVSIGGIVSIAIAIFFLEFISQSQSEVNNGNERLPLD